MPHITAHAPYLPIGQKGIHSLQEPRVQDIGLVHYECYLFIFTARTSQHCPQIFIKVFPCVLPVDLQKQPQVRVLLTQQLRAESRLGN